MHAVDRIRLAGPVAFAEGLLGLTLWSGQREILDAATKHSRVAIRSGHKIGKSTSLAALALWFVCSHPHARVILTASSTRQVEEVVWREVKRLHRNAKILIGGHMHESANGGLKMRTGAGIIGFSTTDTERMAGFSGPSVLFLIDEASGVEDPIYQAIDGNTAGGAQIVATGNPTRTEGFFFQAFQEGSPWHKIAISSERCAEETRTWERTGLASLPWVHERLAEWGVDSPRYKVRVKGDFVSVDESRLISRELVSEAIKRRWPLDGQFGIGVDLARFGDDSSVIAVRRGQSIVDIETLRGLDGPQVLLRLVEVCKRYSSWGKPTVRFDVSGIGQGAAGFFKQEKHAFNFEEINSSNTPLKEGFVRTRDHMMWNFREWLEAGGCLPDSQQLLEDITIPTYLIDEKNRLLVESKKNIRRRIGRSTDVLDACALAVFDGGTVRRNDLQLLRL